MRFLRAKIVQELMQTERDYVNLLQNIVQVREHCIFIYSLVIYYTLSTVIILLLKSGLGYFSES